MASAMALSDLPIGRLAPEELPDAEALVAEAGWNQVGADWRIFLERGTVYAVRADGRVIATAATLPYGGDAPGSAWCWSPRRIADAPLRRACCTAASPTSRRRTGAGARRDPGRTCGLRAAWDSGVLELHPPRPRNSAQR
jgi:hypothetical protein